MLPLLIACDMLMNLFVRVKTDGRTYYKRELVHAKKKRKELETENSAATVKL